MDGTYPGVDLALVVGHHGGDVVLHHVDEGVLVPDVGDPRRELGVPDYTVLALALQQKISRAWELTKGVTTDQLAVGLGKVDLQLVRARQRRMSRENGQGTYQVVRSREGELALAGYSPN